MEGSLKDIHLGGLLRLLSLHRFSGLLHLEGGSPGDIQINDGRLTSVILPGRKPRIGEMLVQEGCLKKTDLEKALALQEKDKRRQPIGHYLVNDLGACAPEAFQKALNAQMSANLSLLLKQREGRFVFREGELPFREFLLTTSTENLILAGLRDVDPQTVEEGLPPLSAILELSPRPANQPLDISFTPSEWNTLILFDGVRNLEDVLRVAGRPSGETERIVFALQSSGLLKKVRFRFPDLEKIAREALDNMGIVLVQNAYANVGVSRARMGMRELIKVLNELEKSMGLIVGPTQAATIVEKMWEATKR